jgi:putative membrane protein insertion efficiency factor
MKGSVTQFVALALLKMYKAMISPWLSPSCRFTPTCSEYAREAIQQYGTVKGVGLTFRRLLRCHPFHKGGWDPV